MQTPDHIYFKTKEYDELSELLEELKCYVIEDKVEKLRQAITSVLVAKFPVKEVYAEMTDSIKKLESLRDEALMLEDNEGAAKMVSETVELIKENRELFETAIACLNNYAESDYKYKEIELLRDHVQYLKQIASLTDVAKKAYYHLEDKFDGLEIEYDKLWSENEELKKKPEKSLTDNNSKETNVVLNLFRLLFEYDKLFGEEAERADRAIGEILKENSLSIAKYGVKNYNAIDLLPLLRDGSIIYVGDFSWRKPSLEIKDGEVHSLIVENKWSPYPVTYICDYLKNNTSIWLVIDNSNAEQKHIQ